MASVQEIRGGWDSFTFLVDGDHILKFARNADAAAGHRREAALLPKLAAAVSFRVPEPDFFGTFGEEHTIIGYPRIEGRPLTENDGWRALAGALRELHGFPVDVAREALGEPGRVADWQRWYEEFAERVFRQVLPVLDDELSMALAREFTVFLNGDWEFPPTLVHRDLAPEHVLVDDTGRLVGLIDFSDATIGDPAIDFAGLLPVLGPERIETLIADYGRPVDRDRLRGYWQLAPVHEVLHGLAVGNQQMTDNAITELRRRVS